MHKEPNLTKRSWIISLDKTFRKTSYYILKFNDNTKQLYFQLQKILTDNNLC